jgi:DnaJ-class molecular chaperone
MPRKKHNRKPEHTYDKIVWARNIMDLAESATMQEIKDNYRKMIHRWHPDKCREDQKICREMTNKIIQAYKIIIDYCSRYKFSFTQKEVEKYLSADEWWFKKFGSDPVWGSGDSQQKK